MSVSTALLLLLATRTGAEITELDNVTNLPFGGAVPIWSSNATAQFVLLRRPFRLPPSLRVAPLAPPHAVLHISAQPIPNRLAGPRHGGSLASKLLCAYKLWVNGVPVGAGPGRPTGINSTREAPALLYDSFDVGGLLRQGGADNVVAIEAFYWTAKQESAEVGCPPGEGAYCVNGSNTDLDPGNPRDFGGVLAWLSVSSSANNATNATALHNATAYNTSSIAPHPAHPAYAPSPLPPTSSTPPTTPATPTPPTPPPLLRTGDDGWRVYTHGDKGMFIKYFSLYSVYVQCKSFAKLTLYHRFTVLILIRPWGQSADGEPRCDERAIPPTARVLRHALLPERLALYRVSVPVPAPALQ